MLDAGPDGEDQAAFHADQLNRQRVVSDAVERAYRTGLISRDEAWAIGYESGIPLRLEDQ